MSPPTGKSSLRWKVLSRNFTKYLPALRLRKRVTSDSQARESPFDRLPVEIIQEIFKCCLPKLEYDSQTHLFDITDECQDMVCTLSDVCETWREIALATPELWAYLTVSDNEDNPPLMLLRSKCAPLCATIDDYDEALHHSLFSETQISRWRAMCITLERYPIEEVVKISSLLEGKSSPHLEMLKFTGKYGIEAKQVRGLSQGVFSLLSTSSKVEYFSWTNLPLPIWSQLPVNFTGFSRLTTIILDNIYGTSSADDYIRYLAMCKCAKKIKLYVRDEVEDPIDSHTVSVLPQVEVLEITTIRIGAILPFFTLPKLRELDMAVAEDSDSRALDQCCERSRFELTTLCIRFWNDLVYQTSMEQYLELGWIAEPTFGRRRI